MQINFSANKFLKTNEILKQSWNRTLLFR